MRPARSGTGSLPRSVPLVLAALVALLLVPVRPVAAGSLEETAQRLFPHVKIESVEPSPVPGIYEVRTGRNLIYMDGTGRYVFVGELYDFAARKNLTAEKMAALNTVDFGALPMALAIHLGPADATKRLAMFSDVDCPFCKKFHQETLPDLFKAGIGVDVYLFPLSQLHPGAFEKSRRVWCSPDRSVALERAMEGQALPEAASDCRTPIAEIAELASKLGISGTPTLVLDSGQRVDGFLSYDVLMTRWKPSPRKSDAGPLADHSTPVPAKPGATAKE